MFQNSKKLIQAFKIAVKEFFASWLMIPNIVVLVRIQSWRRFRVSPIKTKTFYNSKIFPTFIISIGFKFQINIICSILHDTSNPINIIKSFESFIFNYL